MTPDPKTPSATNLTDAKTPITLGMMQNLTPKNSHSHLTFYTKMFKARNPHHLRTPSLHRHLFARHKGTWYHARPENDDPLWNVWHGPKVQRPPLQRQLQWPWCLAKVSGGKDTHVDVYIPQKFKNVCIYMKIKFICNILYTCILHLVIFQICKYINICVCTVCHIHTYITTLSWVSRQC